MFKRLVKWSVSVSLLLPGLVCPSGPLHAQGVDRNTKPSGLPQTAPARTIFNPAAFSSETSKLKPIIGSVTLASPNTSTDITLNLTNLSNQSTIGARDIRAVIIDCFPAAVRRSLTIDAVTVTSPPGGTATVTTGNDADDVGPAVITFTDFNAGESVTVTLDPDTWINPLAAPTRRQMVGCQVELVFFPANNLRGDGTMRLLSDGSVQAAIVQRRDR